ncbi:hypothetical protein KCU95_g20367, partial [Aureobasidium melanogenum]
MKAVISFARLFSSQPGFSRPTHQYLANRAFSTSIHHLNRNEQFNMGKDKGDKGGFQLKVPKGTKDWEGKDMVIRDKIFSTITNVFKRHGAVTIDT